MHDTPPEHTLRALGSSRLRLHIAQVSLIVALASSPVAAAPKVRIRFDARGLSSLTVDGREFLADGSARLTHAVLERRDPAKPGLGGYAFEKPDLSKPRVSVEATAATVRHAYAWGTVAFAYAPSPGRLTVAVTIANTSKRSLATFDLALGRIRLPAPPKNLKRGHGRIVSTQDNLGIVTADYGTGKLLACCETVDRIM